MKPGRRTQKKTEKIETRLTRVEKNRALARMSASRWDSLSAFVRYQILDAPTMMKEGNKKRKGP